MSVQIANGQIANGQSTSSPTTSPQSEQLYSLLPLHYRRRDQQEGEPLRALLAILETELVGLQNNVEDLYDNWFIETCDDWVVPYIGDLLGYSLLPEAATLADMQIFLEAT